MLGRGDRRPEKMRTTITIRKDLHKRMIAYGKTHDVNWSHIAGEAFEAVLKEAEMHLQGTLPPKAEEALLTIVRREYARMLTQGSPSKKGRK